MVVRPTVLNTAHIVERVIPSTISTSTFSKPAGTASDFATWIGLPEATPSNLWLLNDSTTSLSDSIGEVTLTGTVVTLVERKALGLWDGSSFGGSNIKAVECPTASSNVFTASDTTKCDLTTGSGAVMVIFRAAQPQSTTRGIVGKQQNASNSGYALEILNTGQLTARVHNGVSSVIVITSFTGRFDDGDWHYAVLIVDRTAQVIRVLTDLGVATSNTISGIGSLTNSQGFTLGTGRGLFALPAQYCLAAFFAEAAAEGLNNPTMLTAWWNRVHTTTPSGWNISRSSVVGVWMPPDSEGDAFHMWTYGHWSPGYLAGKLGLQVNPAYNQLLTYHDVGDSSGWTVSGAIVTGAFGDCPRRMRNAVRIQKNGGNSDRVYATASLTSGTTYTFAVFAKCSDTTNRPMLRIRDNGDTTTLASYTMTVEECDGTWKLIWLTYTAASTATHRFGILPSQDNVSTGDAQFQYAIVSDTSSPVPCLLARNATTSAADMFVTSTAGILTPAEGRVAIDYAVVTQIPAAPRALFDVTTATDRRAVFLAQTTGNESIQIRDASNNVVYNPADGAVPTRVALSSELRWRAVGPSPYVRMKYHNDTVVTNTTTAFSATTTKRTLALGSLFGNSNPAFVVIHSLVLFNSYH